MNQRPALSQLTSDEKDALIEALWARLAEQDARIKELEWRVGLNSSNSGKPPASDGYKKKPRSTNLRERTGKKPGGQAGHEGKNLGQVENPDQVVDHWPSACAGCGARLGLEPAPGYRRRQVFDLPKPPVGRGHGTSRPLL